MRELLFRGKRTYNGEWVYGDFTGHEGKAFIGVWEKYAPYEKEWATLIEVAPETVGQFTGITDKNGNKIFEGDIVQDVNAPAKKRKVRFMKYHSLLEPFSYLGWVVCTPGLNDSLAKYYIDRESNSFKLCYEVCGNIFDNADLLNKV